MVTDNEAKIGIVTRGYTLPEIEMIIDKLREDEAEIFYLKSRLDFWRRRARTRQDKLNQLTREVSKA